MQRYRVNLPLLIGLVVGSAVLVGGIYGLYRLQRSRNADRLLEREQVARAEGDLEQSAELLLQYLSLRTNDEVAMVRLSETLLDIASLPRSEPVSIQRALRTSEQAVRNFPQQTELRRRLADMYMSSRSRNLKRALDHVKQLLNRSPGDKELLAMQSDCLFATQDSKRVKHAYKLIGYDESTDAFSSEKATAPEAGRVYLMLARALRGDSNEELADRVIEQMVEVNPESGEVQLYRGQYAELRGGLEEATPHYAKALELAPDDPDVIVQNTRLAIADKDFDRARELLEGGIEKNADNPGLYLMLSRIRAAAGELEAAIEVCARGMNAVPIDQWQTLLVEQTRFQLQSDSPEDARATIKKMRELRVVRSAFPDYFEARLMVTEGRWFEAAQVFEKYESFMSTADKRLGTDLNMMLGLCREKLGEKDLALAAYERAYQISPGNTPAELSVARMQNALGARPARANGNAVSIYQALSLEIAKPEAEQDWEAFDLLAQNHVEKLRLGEAMLEVLRGEILMRRKKYSEARERLRASFEIDKTNLGVRRAAVKLFAADPDQGPVKALKLLDLVVDQFGDLPILRIDRADLLRLIYPENLTDQLFALGEDTDDWTDKQRVQLWRGLAQKFQQLNDNESRAECLRRVAALSASDLPTLVSLFQIARSDGDQDAMREAQDQILGVVGSKENATWMYTEAQRLLAEWQAAGGQGNGLEEASQLVKKAIAKRGEWNELYNLQATLRLARRDIRGALASYDRATSLGRQDARSSIQYIKLLMSQARYADALRQLDKINREGRTQVLGQDYAECLLRVGRDAEAVIAAQEYLEQAPKNAQSQLWAGRLFSRASAVVSGTPRSEELVELAGDAFQASVAINPRSSEAWMALVGYYAASKQLAAADDTIRKAQVALEEDQNLLMFARCYEIVGRRVDAEGLYEQALETAQESAMPRVARLAARFYLSPAYNRPDAVQRATPLINSILRRTAEGDLPADDTNARWARSTAAKLLAQRGTYQQLRDAERLLSSNVTDGVLPVADRLLMAEILAPRPEPVSRLKAARLLEDVRENQQLSQPAELSLAQLYFSLGEWRKCRQQIESIIARDPQNPQPRLAYLEMLLQRGESADIDRAVRQVKRLYEQAPNAITTREMLARVAHQRGEDRKATTTLLSLLPKKANAITEKQLPLLRRVGLRLVEFEQYDKAERVYELAAKVGTLSDRAKLALFLGEHIDPEQGFASLDAISDQLSSSQRILVSNQILRAAADADSPALEPAVARVEGWIRQALREDPDQVGLRLQQAELYDILREYEKAIELYQSVLGEKNLEGNLRAVTLNNLSYLLALAEPDATAVDQAKEYIDQAVGLLGPGADILDTRAVIAIADKRYDDAIADLKLAVIDKPSASKYYHLAVAYLRADRGGEASSAWKEAVKRGLTRESVSRLEREQYDGVKQQIENGSLTSVSS